MLEKEKNLAFMRDPGRWPQGYPAIHLKKYINLKAGGSMDSMDFGRLSFKHGQYTFIPDQGPVKEGGDELLVEIVNNGWMVD